ncbi:MAG: hypothetical protein P8X90_23880 [Desulfobacterales bacterium]
MSAAYDTYRTLMTSGRFEDAARLAESEYLKDDAGNPFWLTRPCWRLPKRCRALRNSRRRCCIMRVSRITPDCRPQPAGEIKGWRKCRR